MRETVGLSRKKSRMGRYCNVDLKVCIQAGLVIALAIPITGLQSAKRALMTAPAGVCSDADKLDREFYNDYLDSIPDPNPRRKKVLETNLLQIIKRNVPRRDINGGREYAKTVKITDLVYKRVTLGSPFVRGIFKEIRYLKPTPHMYIVKTGKYMIFMTFVVDPRRFIVTSKQIKIVIKTPKERSHKPTG